MTIKQISQEGKKILKEVDQYNHAYQRRRDAVEKLKKGLDHSFENFKQSLTKLLLD